MTDKLPNGLQRKWGTITTLEQAEEEIRLLDKALEQERAVFKSLMTVSQIQQELLDFFQPQKKTEYCDCSDCKDSEDPCQFDCEVDDLCEGCFTENEHKKDIQFEIDQAQGRR